MNNSINKFCWFVFSGLLLFLVSCGGSDNNSSSGDSTPSPLATQLPPAQTPTPTPTAEPTSTPTPEPPSNTLIFEAEVGIPAGGAMTYDDDAASGGGGMAYLSTTGASVTWLDLPAANAVSINYATALPGGMITATVDGQGVGDMVFTSTGDWTGTYNNITYAVQIPEGGSFSIEFSPGNTAINLDYIELHPETLTDAIALVPSVIVETPPPFEYPEPDGLNKYEPQGAKVIMFIGQDNEGVGGNFNIEDPQEIWSGYVDAGLPVPAGVTTYIGLRDDSETPDERDNLPPEGFTVQGLHNVADYGAGPICLKCYLENSSFDPTDMIVHLSIFYADDVGHSRRVADGETDVQIREVANFIKAYPDVAFMIRPGYEFNAQYQNVGVTALDYQNAFRRVVDIFREEGVTNFASIYSSSSRSVPISSWEDYFPGNDYVDWIGYSMFSTEQISADDNVFVFARGVDKPVIISEVVPRDVAITEENGQELFSSFFTSLFNTSDILPEQVKAIAYINTDWTVHALWNRLGIFNLTDSRIQNSSVLVTEWNSEMADDRYILSDDNVLEAIRFDAVQQ